MKSKLLIGGEAVGQYCYIKLNNDVRMGKIVKYSNIDSIYTINVTNKEIERKNISFTFVGGCSLIES